jgi:hypothetical protein
LLELLVTWKLNFTSSPNFTSRDDAMVSRTTRRRAGSYECEGDGDA